MAGLGVSLSFSGRRVGNDKASTELSLNIMTCRQGYPLGSFRDLLSVKVWVDGFVDSYIAEHRASGIKRVTPQSEPLRPS
jgi:hypothetical protein